MHYPRLKLNSLIKKSHPVRDGISRGTTLFDLSAHSIRQSDKSDDRFPVDNGRVPARTTGPFRAFPRAAPEPEAEEALPEAIRETRWLLGGVGAVASALAQPLLGLLVVLQSLAGVALDLFAKVSHILSRLAVVNQAMMALSLLLMMLVSTYVIARDLRLLPFAVSRKEH